MRQHRATWTRTGTETMMWLPGDPQADEDEHVKDVKTKSGAK